MARILCMHTSAEDRRLALNWKGMEKLTSMEPCGELATDSMCEAFRPEGLERNEKWRPTCALTQAAAMHPFMEPYGYLECLETTQQ